MTTTVSGRTRGQAPPGGAPEGDGPPAVPAWRRKARPYLLSVPAVAIIVGIMYPFVLGAYYSVLELKDPSPLATPELGAELWRRSVEWTGAPSSS